MDWGKSALDAIRTDCLDTGDEESLAFLQGPELGKLAIGELRRRTVFGDVVAHGVEDVNAERIDLELDIEQAIVDGSRDASRVEQCRLADRQATLVLMAVARRILLDQIRRRIRQAAHTECHL